MMRDTFRPAGATQVFRSLIMRDTYIRYGRENFGFLWVIGKPILSCSGVMVSLTSQLRGYILVQ